MQVTDLYRLIIGSDVKIHIDTLYKARKAGYMSRSLALICEAVTGINREKWVFPEKFGDPWKLKPKNK